jgi:homocysteine S-methyltransferase
VGPYGAALADGSEYRGDPGPGVPALRRWHRPRLQQLLDAGPDVLALETLPSLAEVEALLAEVAGTGVPAWLSVTAAGGRTRAGEPLDEVFAVAADVPEVVAVGVNCCDPAEVPAAAAAARGAGRPAVAYPNSGERWDAARRRWAGEPEPLDAAAWVAAGVRLVGGCCRVGPAVVRGLARACAGAPPSGP